MKKLQVYLETSLFGFYYDENPRNVTKKESVIELFDQIKERKFVAYTSPIKNKFHKEVLVKSF